MKFTNNALAFLLIFSLPSMVLGKTFTNCGGDFGAFLTKAEGYATQLGVSSRVLKKTKKFQIEFPRFLQKSNKRLQIS